MKFAVQLWSFWVLGVTILGSPGICILMGSEGDVLKWSVYHFLRQVFDPYKLSDSEHQNILQIGLHFLMHFEGGNGIVLETMLGFLTCRVDQLGLTETGTRVLFLVACLIGHMLLAVFSS